MAAPDPRLDVGCRVGTEPDERAPAVVGVLAAPDEPVVLELPGQLARRGQREAELGGELADRLLALGADVGEHADVAPAERRVAVDEREQLGRRPSPRPDPAHHPMQQVPQFRQVI